MDEDHDCDLVAETGVEDSLDALQHCSNGSGSSSSTQGNQGREIVENPVQEMQRDGIERNDSNAVVSLSVVPTEMEHTTPRDSGIMSLLDGHMDIRSDKSQGRRTYTKASFTVAHDKPEETAGPSSHRDLDVNESGGHGPEKPASSKVYKADEVKVPTEAENKRSLAMQQPQTTSRLPPSQERADEASSTKLKNIALNSAGLVVPTLSEREFNEIDRNSAPVDDWATLGRKPLSEYWGDQSSTSPGRDADPAERASTIHAGDQQGSSSPVQVRGASGAVKQPTQFKKIHPQKEHNKQSHSTGNGTLPGSNNQALDQSNTAPSVVKEAAQSLGLESLVSASSSRDSIHDSTSVITTRGIVESNNQALDQSNNAPSGVKEAAQSLGGLESLVSAGSSIHDSTSVNTTRGVVESNNQALDMRNHVQSSIASSGVKKAPQRLFNNPIKMEDNTESSRDSIHGGASTNATQEVAESSSGHHGGQQSSAVRLSGEASQSSRQKKHTRKKHKHKTRSVVVITAAESQTRPPETVNGDQGTGQLSTPQERECEVPTEGSSDSLPNHSLGQINHRRPERRNESRAMKSAAADAASGGDARVPGSSRRPTPVLRRGGVRSAPRRQSKKKNKASPAIRQSDQRDEIGLHDHSQGHEEGLVSGEAAEPNINGADPVQVVNNQVPDSDVNSRERRETPDHCTNHPTSLVNPPGLFTEVLRTGRMMGYGRVENIHMQNFSTSQGSLEQNLNPDHGTIEPQRDDQQDQLEEQQRPEDFFIRPDRDEDKLKRTF